MKKKIVIAVIIILIIIVLIVINSQNWNLQSCEEECIHRGYDSGNCMWPSEISGDEINIGSCLISQSRHCGNKGQCNCYCEYEKSIGGDTDEHGCYLMAGYNWCKSKQECVRFWEEGCEDCETDSDCVVFGETGDCNCGCYNKEALPQGTGGECFCAAPKSCECVDGVCERFFD